MTVDELFMKEALLLAKEAEKIDEVPIGALIVCDGEIIARAYNTREHSKCATHHAEILAIEAACRALGGWRLPRCTLYVTLEPCLMCAGAISNARIDRVVFGARDPKGGAMGGMTDVTHLPLNHVPEIVGGVLEEECALILSRYFQKKREVKSAWNGKGFTV